MWAGDGDRITNSVPWSGDPQLSAQRNHSRVAVWKAGVTGDWHDHPQSPSVLPSTKVSELGHLPYKCSQPSSLPSPGGIPGPSRESEMPAWIRAKPEREMKKQGLWLASFPAKNMAPVSRAAFSLQIDVTIFLWVEESLEKKHCIYYNTQQNRRTSLL